MILVGISVLRPAFEEFNCVISFNTRVLCTVENEKFIVLLPRYTSPILSMLGWFLYFTIEFKTGILWDYLFRLLTIFEKVFKIRAVPL